MIGLKYSSWYQVPIKVYGELRDVLESEEERDEEKMVYILSILTGLDIDNVLDLSLFDYERLAAKAMFVYRPIPKRPVGIRHLTIDGRKFDVQTDFSKVTTAQYMDFTNYFRDPKKYYSNILSTFIIPQGHRYNEGYEASEVAELFNEKLSIADADNACFFFASWSMNSMRLILTLYQRRAKKMMRKIKDKEQREKMEEVVNLYHQQKQLLDGLATSMRLVRPRG